MPSIFDNEPKIRVNPSQRYAKLTWELGAGQDFDGEPCTAVTQLNVSHDRDRKRFLASAQRVDVNDRGEKFAPFGGTRVRLQSQPVTRYSARAFRDAIEAALGELRSRADEPEVAAVADPSSPA